MYRRPKFLEILLEIRREMAHEADYDVDLFTEMARSGVRPSKPKGRPSRIAPEETGRAEAAVPELTRSEDT